jgi:hypothetical protein
VRSDWLSVKGLHSSPIRITEAQRVRQTTPCVGVWKGVETALEIMDAAFAQSSASGQLSLS